MTASCVESAFLVAFNIRLEVVTMDTPLEVSTVESLVEKLR